MQTIWESWPQWLVDSVVSAYQSGQHPATIGAVIKRSEAVIRSKLVRKGVYISAAAKRQIQILETAEGF